MPLDSGKSPTEGDRPQSTSRQEGKAGELTKRLFQLAEKEREKRERSEDSDAGSSKLAKTDVPQDVSQARKEKEAESEKLLSPNDPTQHDTIQASRDVPQQQPNSHIINEYIKGIMMTVTMEHLREIIDGASKKIKDDPETYHRISDACIKISLFRKEPLRDEDNHKNLEKMYPIAISEYEAIKCANFLLRGKYMKNILDTKSPEKQSVNTQPETGSSTETMEWVQGHLTEQAHQGLKKFMGYAEAGEFPNDAFSALSPVDRHRLKPDILKELITDWKEPRTFKELEGFCKELLQNGGEFSNTTRESLLNSRDTRFTNNEVTLLQGMTLFTIKNKEQETKEKYINSINHMSQINFDLWGK